MQREGEVAIHGEHGTDPADSDPEFYQDGQDEGKEKSETEVGAEREKQATGGDAEPLLVRVQAGRDEGPHLPEDHRQGYDQGGLSSDR